MTRDEIIRLVEQRQQIEPPPMLEQLQQGDIHWILGSRDVLWIVEQAIAANQLPPPIPPPEAKTHAEMVAHAFGYWQGAAAERARSKP